MLGRRVKSTSRRGFGVGGGAEHTNEPPWAASRVRWFLRGGWESELVTDGVDACIAERRGRRRWRSRLGRSSGRGDGGSYRWRRRPRIGRLWRIDSRPGRDGTAWRGNEGRRRRRRRIWKAGKRCGSFLWCGRKWVSHRSGGRLGGEEEGDGGGEARLPSARMNGQAARGGEVRFRPAGGNAAAANTEPGRSVQLEKRTMVGGISSSQNKKRKKMHCFFI